MAYRFPHPSLAKRLFVLSLVLGLFSCQTDSPQPTLAIVSPEDGETLMGDQITVRILAKHWSAGETDGGHNHGQAPQDGPEALLKAGEVLIGGHVQIFLDIVSDKDADARAAIHQGDTAVLVGIKPGRHFLIAQGVDKNYKPVKGMRDSISFVMASTQTGF